MAQAIRDIPQSGFVEAPENDVIFIDVYGNRLYSYTYEESKKESINILLFDFIKGEILEITSQENLDEILNTLRKEYKEETDLIIVIECRQMGVLGIQISLQSQKI